MSQSPAAQQAHGTGSGRRTMPTTRSPRLNPQFTEASCTVPSDSWPITRRLRPGGAQPYRPATISRSVPQTPSAKLRTSTAPSDGGGSGTSSTLAELAVPGATVRARIVSSCKILRKPRCRRTQPSPRARGETFVTEQSSGAGTGPAPAPLHQIRQQAWRQNNDDARTDALGHRGGLYPGTKLILGSGAGLARDRLHSQRRRDRGPC